MGKETVILKEWRKFQENPDENKLKQISFALDHGWTLSEIFCLPEHHRRKAYFVDGFPFWKAAQFYRHNLRQINCLTIDTSPLLTSFCNKEVFYNLFKHNTPKMFAGMNFLTYAGENSIILKPKYGFGGSNIDRIDKNKVGWTSHQTGVTYPNELSLTFALMKEERIVQRYIEPVKVPLHQGLHCVARYKAGLKMFCTARLKVGEPPEFQSLDMLRLTPEGSIVDNASNDKSLICKLGNSELYEGMPNNIRISNYWIYNSGIKAERIDEAKNIVRSALSRMKSFEDETIFTFSADFIVSKDCTYLLEMNAFPSLDIPQLFRGVGDPYTLINHEFKVRKRRFTDWVSSKLYKSVVMSFLKERSISIATQTAKDIAEYDQVKLDTFLGEFAVKYNSKEGLQSNNYDLLEEGRYVLSA